MGDMADYYGVEDPSWMTQEFADLEQKPFRDDPPLPTKTVWVTKDGERVAVKDMADSHLLNTIRMLRRNAPKMMLAEAMSIGRYLAGGPPDGAFDAASQAEQELTEMDEDEFLSVTIPTYDALVKEATKRKLLDIHFFDRNLT